MINILTIIGARPQFVKAAVLSRLIRSEDWKTQIHETILHTGQHYDENMSEIFFRDMQIPKPDIQLHVGGTTHGAMTGQMLIEIEAALFRVKPDMVLVYGDTNSTLSGALASSKHHIPVIHVESGLRSFNMRMPEEQNRILTDHLATWLFCPTDTAVNNLSREGITNGVHQVGDIMLDATLFYQRVLAIEEQQGKNRLSNLNLKHTPEHFLLATIHRAENTDKITRLTQIVEALNEVSCDIILPLHPRTRKKLSELNILLGDNIKAIEPIGYLEMLALEMRADAIITDSGGVQKEAYFLKKPCITLRDETEWIETLEDGWNTLVGADKQLILNALNKLNRPAKQHTLFGTGDAGSKIINLLAHNV
jgi:UDP-GlcNAc3NAcA epimerase